MLDSAPHWKNYLSEKISDAMVENLGFFFCIDRLLASKEFIEEACKKLGRKLLRKISGL